MFQPTHNTTGPYVHKVQETGNSVANAHDRPGFLRKKE